ncbi:MAG: helix-turn-helix domain-containing protein [Bacilli bacterium]
MDFNFCNTTHQEIANMLGASREAVSGVMSELAKEGVVKISRLSVQLAVTILEENIPRNSTH